MLACFNFPWSRRTRRCANLRKISANRRESHRHYYSCSKAVASGPCVHRALFSSMELPKNRSSGSVWMPLPLDLFQSKCSRSTTAGARYETFSAGPLGRRSDVPCAPREAASEAAVRSDRVLCGEKVLGKTQRCRAGTPGAQMQFHATSMELLRSRPTDSTSPSLPKAVLGSYHRRRGSSLRAQPSSLRGARLVQGACERMLGLCPCSLPIG